MGLRVPVRDGIGGIVLRSFHDRLDPKRSARDQRTIGRHGFQESVIRRVGMGEEGQCASLSANLGFELSGSSQGRLPLDRRALPLSSTLIDTGGGVTTGGSRGSVHWGHGAFLAL